METNNAASMTNQARKPLRRLANRALFHIVKGQRIDGPNPAMSGDCSGLYGNCSGLYGDCTGLHGNLDEIPLSARPCNISKWVEEQQ